MRPGTESEPEMDCSESLRGLGLMMRSEGLPRNEAAVMLMLSAVAIMRGGGQAELVGQRGPGSEGETRLRISEADAGKAAPWGPETNCGGVRRGNSLSNIAQDTTATEVVLRV